MIKIIDSLDDFWEHISEGTERLSKEEFVKRLGERNPDQNSNSNFTPNKSVGEWMSSDSESVSKSDFIEMWKKFRGPPGFSSLTLSNICRHIEEIMKDSDFINTFEPIYPKTKNDKVPEYYFKKSGTEGMIVTFYYNDKYNHYVHDAKSFTWIFMGIDGKLYIDWGRKEGFDTFKEIKNYLVDKMNQ